MAQILDSGSRRTFNSGAVRDVGEGKGRCDLLPFDVLALVMADDDAAGLFRAVNCFLRDRSSLFLQEAMRQLAVSWWPDLPTAVLELAKHYEAGAEKYAARNWEQGIPLHCYLDSGARHYLKALRGDDDEPHRQACLWNLCGLLWTYRNKPELDDLPLYDKQEAGQ